MKDRQVAALFDPSGTAASAAASDRVLVADYPAHSSQLVNAVFVINRVGLVAEVEYHNEGGAEMMRLFAVSKVAE